jgi:hypothetical protein
MRTSENAPSSRTFVNKGRKRGSKTPPRCVCAVG